MLDADWDFAGAQPHLVSTTLHGTRRLVHGYHARANMTGQSRPKIPKSIELAVRQKCRFACVNPECRCPIWDYEHIVDYSIVKEHREDNIVLLCPTCNQARKGAQFSRDRIIKWLQALSNQTRPERLFFDFPTVDFGSNFVTSACMQSAYVFQIGRSYLHISSDNKTSSINAEFWNKNGELSLKIENSRYTLYTDVWDINYKRGDEVKNTPGVLTFKNGPGDTFLEVEFHASNNRIGVYGKFWPADGCCLAIQRDGIYAGDTLLSRYCAVQGAQQLAFWVRDGSPLYSAIGPIFGVYNVINAEYCGILDTTVGFVWDVAFLLDPKRHRTLGGLKGIGVRGQRIPG